MMFLLVSSIIAAAISGTSATPVVTAVPISGGCEAYPNYDNNTQMAFPLLAKVTNSDNPAIEGFFDTDDVSIGVGSRGPVLRWGYVRDYFYSIQPIPTQITDTAHVSLLSRPTIPCQR